MTAFDDCMLRRSLVLGRTISAIITATPRRRKLGDDHVDVEQAPGHRVCGNLGDSSSIKQSPGLE
jgi:hypothetical protein